MIKLYCCLAHASWQQQVYCGHSENTDLRMFSTRLWGTESNGGRGKAAVPYGFRSTVPEWDQLITNGSRPQVVTCVCARYICPHSQHLAKLQIFWVPFTKLANHVCLCQPVFVVCHVPYKMPMCCVWSSCNGTFHDHHSELRRLIYTDSHVAVRHTKTNKTRWYIVPRTRKRAQQTQNILMNK